MSQALHAPVLGSATVDVTVATSDGTDEGNRMALARAMGSLGWQDGTWELYHSPWGQPRIRWMRTRRGVPAPMVSMSHDAGMGIVAVTLDPCVRGIGADVVAPHRFQRISSSHDLIHRFCTHVLTCREREWLCEHPNGRNRMAHLLARTFATKEAVSKALGTGLRLGLGMGAGFAPLPKEVQALVTDQRANATVGGSAHEHLERMGGGPILVALDERNGYTLAVAAILRHDRRNPPSPRSVLRVSWDYR